MGSRSRKNPNRDKVVGISLTQGEWAIIEAAKNLAPSGRTLAGAGWCKYRLMRDAATLLHRAGVAVWDEQPERGPVLEKGATVKFSEDEMKLIESARELDYSKGCMPLGTWLRWRILQFVHDEGGPHA